jgi:hypothetical protein
LWHPESLSAFGRPAEAVPATGAVTVVPAILTSLADAPGKTGQALEGFKHLNVAARQGDAGALDRVGYESRSRRFANRWRSGAAEQSFQKTNTVARQQSAKLWSYAPPQA